MHSVAELAPGRHLTLITVHAKGCTACITVTTMPRKYKKVRSIREAYSRDSVLTCTELQLGCLSRATFVMFSYLHDVQALLLPRARVDLLMQTNYMLLINAASTFGRAMLANSKQHL